MTIILFLIDTSASMSQKAHVNGTQKSYLDIAKGAVETFLKYRQRSQDCMGDRYMLLTFEDPPCNVKAGWKENHATFMNELKNLLSNGLTSMGEALKNAFDLLNLNRMVSGIDTYGQGRCPFYLEPSVIIVITDGGRYSFRNGIHQEIILPLHAQIPGAKLTKEPFRWDQRLFSLVLRMAGNRMEERVEGKVPHDDSPIEKMCEVTGGRSYKIRSHYVLNQCIESLVQKVQPGVVVHFDQLMPKELKDGEVQELAFQPTKKMIYVQKHPSQKAFPVGFWPIPEPYWPDPKSTSLPPRDAHPKIRIILPCVDEPSIVRHFPIDKYELEACPLTLQILSKKEPNKIWPLMVSNQNGMHGNEMPFGYLKANSTNTVVHLFVLPYNYQTLLPLINDFFQRFNGNPPTEWIYKFTNYVKSIPQYYCPFLRRALMSANVPFNLLNYILPENLDIYLSPAVANYLKQMKNTAKQDQENLCLRVFKQLKVAKPPYHQIETAKLNSGLALKRDLVTHPMLKETFSKLHQEINVYENYSITVPTLMNSVATKNYRNPFDIPRKDLIDEIARMRENFFKIPTVGINLYTKDAGHCLPIAEMGNYQEYLKNKETPLRELEPTNVRQHMFGNPYKKDKNMVMVDEADLGEMAPLKNAGVGTTTTPQKLNPKLKRRRAGPIRRDYVYKRTRTNSTDSMESSGGSSMLSGCCLSDIDNDSDNGSDSLSIDLDASPSGDVSSLSPSSQERMDFDLDEPTMEDFPNPMNGHVQNFINGFDPDDPAEVVVPIIQQPPVIAAVLRGPVEPSTPPPPPSTPPTALPPQQFVPFSPAAPVVLVVPPSPPVVVVLPPVVPVQLTNGPPPSPAPDVAAQEISKILQMSCVTNGVTSNNLDSDRVEINNGSLNESDAENAPPNVNSNNGMNNNSINNNNNINNQEPLIPIVVHHHIMNHHVSPTNAQQPIEDDEDTRENIRRENMEARSVIFKDIRKPGRDYSTLISHLSMVKGNFETKFNFVQMCINESLRFRRRKMADSIQEWWETQVDQLSLVATSS